MMSRSDTALVLSKMAAFDQRTIGESDIQAWHEILLPYDITDALEAVTNHYRDNTTRATPADIRRETHRIAQQRAGQARAEHSTPGCYGIVEEFGSATADQVRALEPGKRVNAPMSVEARRIVDELASRLSMPSGSGDPAEERQRLAIVRARQERRERERGAAP